VVISFSISEPMTRASREVSLISTMRFLHERHTRRADVF
jgi:hypothetical protein